MKTYLVVFLGALGLALLTTPLVIRLAHALNVMDHPGVRKVHGAAIPRIGGLALIVPLIVMTLPVFALSNDIGREFRSLTPQLPVFLGASVLVFLTGLLDDVRGLRARTKLLVQLAAAGAATASGTLIDRIWLGGFVIDFGWFAYPLTILWIVGITNAVNLIDGLDGLAVGISLITCTVIAAVAISVHRPVMGVLMLALLGGLSGFLVFNFNPARIFLGDCGSLFLGFFLATASVITSHKTSAIVALALPALALGVPIFDTLFSMGRRLLNRRPIFAPDREHIHHRLLEKGLDQRRVVLVLYGVTVAACALGLVMTFLHDVAQLLLFVLVLFFLVVFFQFSGVVSVRRALQSVRRNQELSREVNGARLSFDSAELRLKEAKTLAEWWEALCLAADALGFVEVALRPVGGVAQLDPLAWRARGARPPDGRLVSISTLLQDEQGTPLARLDCAVRRGRSHEAAARRIALLGRLLDERPAPLPGPPPSGR